MFEKLNRESLQLLANDLVLTVASQIGLDADEEIQLYDEFYEILDDMFTSRG